MVTNICKYYYEIVADRFYHNDILLNFDYLKGVLVERERIER